jgi:hypothetical protein
MKSPDGANGFSDSLSISFFLFPELPKEYNGMSMESSNASNNGSSEDKPSPQASTNTATNLCIICSTRERALVFVPCGHFGVCVPCGHGLKSCPTCGSNIQALVKIFV